MQIQPYIDDHLGAVIRLSLRAWEPVFDSMQSAMNPDVYREFYPDGWQPSQQRAVEAACSSEEIQVWVALDGAEVAGFVATRLDRENNLGEIYMIAVDPDFQNRGVAAALTDFALARMKDAGMKMAMVETGADAGHFPARRTYEKAGFGLWSVARYFKKL